MCGVHVVDRVRELAAEAEAQRGAEARAVLDVARLGPVVPVHRRDPVAVGGDAGRDRGRAHRRHGRECGDGIVDEAPTGDQRGERRRPALGDGTVDHRRPRSVDDGEDELLQRSTRSPKGERRAAAATATPCSDRRRRARPAATPVRQTSSQRSEHQRGRRRAWPGIDTAARDAPSVTPPDPRCAARASTGRVAWRLRVQRRRASHPRRAGPGQAGSIVVAREARRRTARPPSAMPGGRDHQLVDAHR